MIYQFLNNRSFQAIEFDVAAGFRGPAREFLAQHRRDCLNAATETSDGRGRLAKVLFERIRSPLNLYAAIDYVRRRGVRAAGKDGLQIRSLEAGEKHDLIRCIGRGFTDGQLHTPAPLIRYIPKSNTNANREIAIFNHVDVVVHRAFLQILGPFFDPMFRPTVFARPNRGTDHAVASLKWHFEKQKRHVLVFNDLRDAFGSIPVPRLRTILDAQLPRQLVDAIFRTYGSIGRRGLPQGHALSQLLLDVFLGKALDRNWHREWPREPLLRYVDDIVVAFRTVPMAEKAFPRLTELVRTNGFDFKFKLSASEVEASTQVDWLGYSFYRSPDGGLGIRVANRRMEHLHQQLQRVHDVPDSISVARRILEGWVGSLGPVPQTIASREVLDQVRLAVHMHHVEQVFHPQRLLAVWNGANDRFRRICESLPQATP